MTAIVGTLNKRGIAIAADSAATYSTSATNKITNTANKIFELSKKHPIGIAIYNNLDFYGIPWEVILKTYRDNYLKERSFHKLKEYVEDFWEYLHNVILTKVRIEDQKGQIAYLAHRLKEEAISTAKKILESKNADNDITSLFSEIMSFLIKLSEDFKLHSRTSEFNSYKISQFHDSTSEIIDSILSDLTQDTSCPEAFRETFLSTLFSIIKADTIVYLSQTGLIFWGYGEEELFPSYYHYEVSLAFDNKIKYVELSNYEVSNQKNACVAPFAQTDVANTVVRGIDQKLRDTINNNLQIAFEDFRNNIVDVLFKANAPETLLDALRNMDISNQVTPFIGYLNEYIQNNYIDKLLNTVAYLSKEDLADMAESLVRMTCLKRHITTDEESVGGPVDVAVITKGDGFIWIKRKHYFNRELNPHYFER
jgi:hypothetical protein